MRVTFQQDRQTRPESKIRLNGKLPLLKIFLSVAFILMSHLEARSASLPIEELKKQVEASPENLKVRQSLAQAFFEAGNFQQTIETLRPKAEKLTQDGLTLLAEAYRNVQDALNEGKFLEQLTANYPKHAPGFVLLGAFYFRKAQLKIDSRITMDCLAAYRTAIEVNPTHRPAYEGLLQAFEYFNNNYYNYELRILLGDMIKRFGKAPELMARLCRRNTIDGYFVNARRICAESIGLDPKNPENYIYLSLVENNEGQINRAEGLLKKAVALFPESEFVNSNYADFLIQQKNIPGAEISYQSAAKINPQSFRAQIGLAQVSFELKHYESALGAYRVACQLMPHQTYKRLKSATDQLRHKKESKLEAQYLSAQEKCLPQGEERRAPAQAREEFRSPFALYSKNKISDFIGF